VAKKERLREPLTALPTLEHLNQRISSGWKLVALEWEREAGTGGFEPEEWTEEIPFGLQVSDDCRQLVESPTELQMVVIALDMVVEDCPLSQVAEELNRRGYKTRANREWTPNDLFNLLPRMIQMGPKLFSSAEWMNRRQRLPRVV
jgi:hypothetical protein